MQKTISDLLDLSINLELGIGTLYSLFHDLFEEDEDFWWQLSIEERGHAALLQNEKNSHKHTETVPEGLLSDDIESLKSANTKIESLVTSYKHVPPSRQEARKIAYELETSVGEVHYQEFMSRKNCSLSDELFRQLNLRDKDHADRIEAYAAAHGMTI